MRSTPTRWRRSPTTAGGGSRWSNASGASTTVTSCRPRGDSDEAFALFTFPSLAAYEQYRVAAETDPDCVDAYRLAQDSGCIRRYERRIQRPVFEGAQL